MRRSNTKTILTACEMSFNGKIDNEIASDLGASVSAVSRWRKTAIWIEFEQELITTHKQSLLEAHRLEAHRLEVHRLATLEDGTP